MLDPEPVIGACADEHDEIDLGIGWEQGDVLALDPVDSHGKPISPGPDADHPRSGANRAGARSGRLYPEQSRRFRASRNRITSKAAANAITS